MSEITTQELQTAIDKAIEDSTKALVEYHEKPGIGGKNRAKVAKQISRVTQIILENPDRVASDIGRQTNERTVYDPELAHLEALAIDGNMTRLAAERRRGAMGSRLSHFFGGLRRHDRNMLGSIWGAKLAKELYDEDPIDSGLGTVQLWVDRFAHTSVGRDYKYIKPAKQEYKIPSGTELGLSTDEEPANVEG